MWYNNSDCIILVWGNFVLPWKIRFSDTYQVIRILNHKVIKMYIFILFSSIDIQKCTYFVFVLDINLLLFENFFLKKKSQANVSLLKNFADICTGKKELYFLMQCRMYVTDQEAFRKILINSL